MKKRSFAGLLSGLLAPIYAQGALTISVRGLVLGQAEPVPG